MDDVPVPTEIPHGPGTLGVSERLREFVAEAPYERASILEAVRALAESVEPGARVADVGAGDAPYRELFAHTDYVTFDWEHSVHEGGRNADVQARAESIPVEDGSFDAVVLTQVLEHISDPSAALSEAFRVLAPGGRICVTVPLVWELHETPHDYWRYTPYSLSALLGRAGFESIDVQARNDCFTTLAQLMRNVASAMGSAPDGLDGERERVAGMLWAMSRDFAGLSKLDVNHIFPLGYSASATRPAPHGEP